ncbi:MAG: DNA polymerase III, delta prime subunit [uncultured bacterium]|nr:MAG: DNA polymerase III, delta prime subunit [uncultured bacterium]
MQFIGNEKATNILARSIENAVLNHAYLFSGPAHVGKFTLAKMFALNLIEGVELSLDMEKANKDALLDLIVIGPEIVEKNNVSKQRDISIDAIRDAKQSLSLFPYHGKYKILIIDDAHKMNASAQNGLLKSLEEPNPTTIIILVTHEIDRILPTILSRCQVINFGLVHDDDMKKGFAGTSSFSENCIELSAGRPGLAKQLNENPEERNFRANALQEFSRIRNASLNEKFKMAEEFSKNVVTTLEKLNMWIWEMRKIAISSSQERDNMFNYIGKIQKSMVVLKSTNANSRLILESLFMDL